VFIKTSFFVLKDIISFMRFCRFPSIFSHWKALCAMLTGICERPDFSRHCLSKLRTPLNWEVWSNYKFLFFFLWRSSGFLVKLACALFFWFMWRGEWCEIESVFYDWVPRPVAIELCSWW